MRRLRRSLVPVVLALALGAAPAAQAGQHMLFGVVDNTLEWTPDPTQFLGEASDLGVDAVRITIPWRGLAPTAADQTALGRVAFAAEQTRIVLEIGGGPGSTPPRTRKQQAAYCAYVASVL